MTRKERVSTISCGVASLHIAWAMTYGEWCPQLGRSGFLSAAHCRTVCQFRLAHFPVLMVSTNGSAAHRQQPDSASEVRPGILTRCHERVPGNERKGRL